MNQIFCKFRRRSVVINKGNHNFRPPFFPQLKETDAALQPNCKLDDNFLIEADWIDECRIFKNVPCQSMPGFTLIVKVKYDDSDSPMNISLDYVNTEVLDGSNLFSLGDIFSLKNRNEALLIRNHPNLRISMHANSFSFLIIKILPKKPALMTFCLPKLNFKNDQFHLSYFETNDSDLERKSVEFVSESKVTFSNFLNTETFSRLLQSAAIRWKRSGPAFGYRRWSLAKIKTRMKSILIG